MHTLERVALYRAPTTVCDVDAIADWLKERVDVDVTVRDRFLDVHRSGSEGGEGDGEDEDEGGGETGKPDLAERFANARVLSPYDRETGNAMLGTIRYEERALEQPEREGGVLYDGREVQRALNAALPADERGLECAHVAVLDRAIGTWGDHDGRWHKRVTVLGQPAIVSVPGLYEAPAKPEAYYEEKRRRALLSGDAPPREVLENRVDGEFLIEDDPRTTDALKGYVLQAIHYLETGEAFCGDESCRLYNAHYHEALLEAQLGEPEFCEDHGELYDA